MFTGLIEDVGTVKSILKSGSGYKIEIKTDIPDIHIGDSVAVNGICLTAYSVSTAGFTADVMAETAHRTGIGGLKIGSPVNLERAMAANGRFGGHIVSGHIDGTGTISDKAPDGSATWVTIRADNDILKYIVEKGSIAVDGISLTVAYVDDKCFKVSIIPHTDGNTTLTHKSAGDSVNLECDIIGKYVEKLLSVKDTKGDSKITLEFLAENGF
ncbi:MAG: riboflavin synthase [Firmicutes bacterium]|nr:riboflavin synthase [Bacillota bacterium]